MARNKEMPITRMVMPILLSQFVPSLCSSSELISRAERGAGSGGGESGGGSGREGAAGCVLVGGGIVAGGFRGVSGGLRDGLVGRTPDGAIGSGGATRGGAFGTSGHGGIFVGIGVSTGLCASGGAGGGVTAEVSGAEDVEGETRRRSSS